MLNWLSEIHMISPTYDRTPKIPWMTTPTSHDALPDDQSMSQVNEVNCFEIELSAYISKPAELRVNEDSELQILSRLGYVNLPRSVGVPEW